MIQRQDYQGKYPWLLCCVAFVWANIERLLVFPLPSALRFISLPAWQRLLRCRRKAEPSSSVASTMRASSRNVNIHPHLGPPNPISLASSMWTHKCRYQFRNEGEWYQCVLFLRACHWYNIHVDTIWYNTQRNRVLLKVDNINCKDITKYYQYIVCKREATLQTMPCRSSRLLKPMPTSWHDPVCICFSFMAVQWNI